MSLAAALDAYRDRIPVAEKFAKTDVHAPETTLINRPNVPQEPFIKNINYEATAAKRAEWRPDMMSSMNTIANATSLTWCNRAPEVSRPNYGKLGLVQDYSYKLRNMADVGYVARYLNEEMPASAHGELPPVKPIAGYIPLPHTT